MGTKEELQKYWLDITLINKKHIPLIKTKEGRGVFRGISIGKNSPCLGYLRTRKSNHIQSYFYTIDQGWYPVTSIEECDELTTHYRNEEAGIRKNIQNWVEYRRGLQKMLIEINNIPVEKGVQTKTTYKNLRAKQHEAEGIFYGILARLDRGGRSYKNDGERMHKASDDMKKYKELANKVLRIRNDEYFFEWGDGMYNSGSGVCHYIFAPPPKGKLYGSAETTQLGTGRRITTAGGAYQPSYMINVTKNENEKYDWCYIRTTADLAYVKRNLLAWINRDLEQKKKDLKKARENLLKVKSSLYEIELEREYLAQPELQEKERIAIETAIKAEEIEFEREYAARPRYNVWNSIKTWNNRILWQCGKCFRDNTGEENLEDSEKECSRCRAINKIKITVNVKWNTANTKD